MLLPLSMMSSWKLTALRLGEDRAVSFGIDVRRLRLTTLLRISILSALAVAFVGPIGFIGTVAPHIARMIFGEDHRFYLPASALIGALVLSMASVASKIWCRVIIPVGIVTSLVGVPFFLSIILRHRGTYDPGLTNRKLLGGLPEAPGDRRSLGADAATRANYRAAGAERQRQINAAALAGRAEPGAGQLWLDDGDLMQMPFARRAEKVVYLPQSLPAGVHLHVLESIIVAQRASGGRSNAGSEAEVMALLEQLGIAHGAELPRSTVRRPETAGGIGAVADPSALAAAAG